MLSAPQGSWKSDGADKVWDCIHITNLLSRSLQGIQRACHGSEEGKCEVDFWGGEGGTILSHLQNAICGSAFARQIGSELIWPPPPWISGFAANNGRPFRVFMTVGREKPFSQRNLTSSPRIFLQKPFIVYRSQEFNSCLTYYFPLDLAAGALLNTSMGSSSNQNQNLCNLLRMLWGERRISSELTIAKEWKASGAIKKVTVAAACLSCANFMCKCFLKACHSN